MASICAIPFSEEVFMAVRLHIIICFKEPTCIGIQVGFFNNVLCCILNIYSLPVYNNLYCEFVLNYF